jgi:membrane protease YdiL (CAAX protease family)
VPDEDGPVEPARPDRPDDAPPATPAGFGLRSVPWTFWLWAAVIVLAYLVPRFGPKPTGAEVARESGLSQRSFERYVSVEPQTWTLFVSGADITGRRSKTAREVIDGYAALARDTGSPNMARRAIIAAASQGRAPDKKLFDQLAANLRRSGAKPAEADREAALWRSIYDKAAPAIRGPGEVAAAGAEIRGFHIGFLEDRALQDLYARAGDKTRADAAAARLSGAATSRAFRVGFVAIGMFLAGLTGVVCLILFLVAWRGNNWTLVHRVATQPQRLTWGDLLDAFAFYLAFVRGIGLAVGMTAALQTFSPLAVVSTLYVFTGVGAAVYLWAKARRRGASFADIGLRSPGGLLGDIGYGVLGYCAALPLVVALGWLSRLIFHDRLGATSTPNPILPMIAGERDPTGRVVIYLLVAVAAPVLEELFFRGALFTALRTRFPWALSALISGALFAMVHPVQDWPQILGLGFALATLREMRQSLVPGMVAHCLQNSLAFVTMSLIFGR